LSQGTRRNGSNKFGPFNTPVGGRRAPSGHGAREERDQGYTGRHVSPRPETARKRVGKVVPAAAAAATLAAGAAAYTLAGSGQPQASQLNAAMIRPGAASVSVSGGGHADGSTMVDAAGAAGTPSALITATAKAPAPAHKSTTAASTAAATHSATHAASASQSPASQSPASQSPASTLSCDLNYSLLPQNVTAIVSFLLAHGYSHNAAAGIAGNMYQESKGDPESVGMGGGGLIGWTPLRAGLITGNPSADLQTQLAAVLVYNEGWSSYLPALNAAASPASAAYIYVTDFERAGIPAAGTREASATNVASACGL
jgi:Phage tail lysozyme